MTSLSEGIDNIRKGYCEDTHRLISPEETLDRIAPFLEVMGITRVANVTGLDTIGIPVVMVCRPNSKSLSVSQGKGRSLAAAKASGVMESIESYHAETITSPLKYSSYEELRYSHRLVDVAGLPKIAGSRFHPDFKLLWMEGIDLLNDEAVWVPFELVHTDYTLPLPTGSGCFPLTSNGLASGNHLLEAISHAICEVVERDATSLWNILPLDKKQTTRLNLETVDDPQCLELLEKFDRAGVAVGVWETTTDIGLPSFLCTIINSDTDKLQPLYATSGMGCHPSKHIALIRALTEAAQSRLTYISGSRDDTNRQRYQQSLNLEMLKRFHQQIVNFRQSDRDFRNIPSWDSNTFNQDVAHELSQLRSIGVKRVIAVNLAKKEFQIPVVRVIIPGLEGTDEASGYTPGKRALQLLEQS